MTSNVGSQFILELGEKDRDEMERRVRETLRATFKPEFLNRIDETIVFRNLNPDRIGRIVDIQLGRLRDRLADRKIVLELSPEARNLLAEQGYDRVYGARPLKRAIQKYLENPLSMEILKGNVPDGSRVTADVEDGEMTFRIQ
jgi:ATP-dependent Clp protease ATP-binding subunit ClpB